MTAPPGTLPLALATAAELEFRMGDWQAAYASALESLRVGHATGRREETMHGLTRLALVEAGLGWHEACRRHGERALALASRHADDPCVALALGALGLLELGLGRFDNCIGWLERLSKSSVPPAATWTTDLAEALIRRGDHDRAADALAVLATGLGQTRAFPVRRALERCRGLLAADDEFETHFARALDCGLHLDEPFERARTLLCFGQRLRRVGRRVSARECLRAAAGTFERLGADPWVRTARRELAASGPRARRGVESVGGPIAAGWSNGSNGLRTGETGDVPVRLPLSIAPRKDPRDARAAELADGAARLRAAG